MHQLGKVLISGKRHQEGPGQEEGMQTLPHARCRQSLLFFISPQVCGVNLSCLEQSDCFRLLIHL